MNMLRTIHKIGHAAWWLIWKLWSVVLGAVVLAALVNLAFGNPRPEVTAWFLANWPVVAWGLLGYGLLSVLSLTMYLLPTPILKKAADQLVKEELERADDFLSVRADAYEKAISVMRAHSKEAAMYQLILAYDRGSGSLGGDVFPSDEAREEVHRQFESLFYSAMAVLQEELGIDLEEMGCQVYMPARLNPHRHPSTQ